MTGDIWERSGHRPWCEKEEQTWSGASMLHGTDWKLSKTTNHVGTSGQKGNAGCARRSKTEGDCEGVKASGLWSRMSWLMYVLKCK